MGSNPTPAASLARSESIIRPRPHLTTILFGRTTRSYEYAGKKAPGYPQMRRVKWIGTRDRTDLPRRLLETLDAGLPVFKPAAQQERLALDIWRFTGGD